MKRITGSKSIIVSKKEMKMLVGCNILSDYYSCYGPFYYNLPLFDLHPKAVRDVDELSSDYILIRPNDSKISESFFKNINKYWDKCYDTSK